MRKEVEHTPSGGNVFADLGLANADESLFKAQLTVQILRFVEQKSWTPEEASATTNLSRSEMADLTRGRFTAFTIDRLLNILNRLGHNVEVRISAEESAPEEAQTLVTIG